MNLVLNFSTNLGVGAYYFKYIVGNLGLQSIVAAFQIISIPLAFVIPALLKRTTCVKVIIGGAIIYVVGALVYSFAGASVPLIIVAALCTGIGSVPVSMLVGLLVIDLCDYHEYIGIPRMEGTVSAVSGFATKIGSTLSTGAAGLLLSLSGFISTTEGYVDQPQSAINMIRALMSFIPAGLWVVVAIVISLFTLEKKMPQIREELKARREAAAAEGIACPADQRSGCDVTTTDLLQRQRRGDAVVAVEGIAAEGRFHIRIGAARVVPGPRAVAAVGDVLREVRPGIVIDVQRCTLGSCSAAGIRHLCRDGDRAGLVQYTRRQGGSAGAADAGAGLDAVGLDG